MFIASTLGLVVTVSTSKGARAYHHGDLRAALLEAGLSALSTTSLEEISLRQIARDVGVSATAVYRHFPDKRALLSAMADAGVERLGEAQQAAARAAPSREMFAATGRAYVRFALANPALFRLAFTHGSAHPETVFGDSLAGRMLQEFAARYTSTPEAARRLVVQSWALVHGLAMLMLDGRLPSDEALIGQVIDPERLFALDPAEFQATA